MEQMSNLKLTQEEAARLNAEIEQYLIVMRQANEQMAREQAEIERLKTRTQARLDDLKKVA